METMRNAYVISTLVMATIVSCEDKSVTAQSDCGCDGPVSQTLEREPAIVKYTGNDKDILQILIRSEGQYTYALVPCDQANFPQEFKKNNVKVLLSGQHRKLCSDTGRMAGYPFTVTKIEADDEVVRD